MRSLPVLLTVALSSIPALAQTTYYVDAQGVPPGAGTQLDPWTSIQAALDEPALASGDTILVAPGVYVENLTAPTCLELHIASTGGPEVTEIHPAGPGFVAHLGDGSFTGFAVVGGQGGGIRSGCGADVFDCIVRDCAGVGVSSELVATVSASTIVFNGVGVASAGHGGQAGVEHCIVWGNAQYDLKTAGSNAPLFVKHSIFKTASLSASSTVKTSLKKLPGFWGRDDVHLEPGSPAIGMLGGKTVGALDFDSAYAPAKPRAYCKGKVNSKGCLPSIGFAGAPSVSGAPFDVTLKDTLPGEVGVLFYGFHGKMAPYQGGKLCVVSPLRRTPTQVAAGTGDCGGSYRYDFAALLSSGADPALVVGQGVFAQYWYRDPNDPAGFSCGRSDALAFTILP